MYKDTKTFFDAETSTWYGRQNVQAIYHPDVSVGQVILHTLQKSPLDVKQISANNDVKVTNGELATMSIRFALHLEKLGYQQNDVIGVIANNSHNLAPIVFGSLLSGTPISSLDPTFQKGEIMHMFNVTQPKLVFCDSEKYDVVQESLKELKLNNTTIYLIKGELENVPNVIELYEEIDGDTSYRAPKLIDGGSQTAAILCSSGTTGLPKGVCLSHQLLLRNGITNFRSDDIILCFSTLYWLTGLLILIFATLNNSKRIIIDEPFSLQKCLEIIKNYQITIFLSPPSQLVQICQFKNNTQNNDINLTAILSTVRLYMCGGGSANKNSVKKIQELLTNGKFVVGYGLTEIGGVCALETNIQHRLGSTGQLCDNIQIKLLHKSNEYININNKIGEILINHNAKWLGYYNNKEATELIYENQKWLHTGDLGYFDNDGYLYIIDRIKDILKYNNYHFYPNEIEEVILQLKNDISEVIVCGIPDKIYTNLPAAACVKYEHSNINEFDIYNYVMTKLSNHKYLRGGIYFLTNLPKTPSGKYKRNTIQEMLIQLYNNKNSQNVITDTNIEN